MSASPPEVPEVPEVPERPQLAELHEPAGPVGPPDAASPERHHEPAEALLLEHEYDGIREYDNPLPGWWSAIFIGSVIFAGLYFVYFSVLHWSTTLDEQYQSDLVTYQSKKGARDLADASSATESSVARTAMDPARLEHGAALFATKCVGCHEQGGVGKIGPNLTDGFQLHGSSRMDILRTVREGIPGTAMIAWGEQLAPPDLLDAAAYVTTLRGTNAPGGKPRQGEPVEAFAP